VIIAWFLASPCISGDIHTAWLHRQNVKYKGMSLILQMSRNEQHKLIHRAGWSSVVVEECGMKTL